MPVVQVYLRQQLCTLVLGCFASLAMTIECSRAIPGCDLYLLEFRGAL
ncbi:hypothetical protein QBC99_004237 [Beijerinckia sp. GAS462]|nr:hypothetical protein [Beijerinckia sp. GAS462]SED11685.1 hypothetical protein SAMN05443249_4468 [Beijerinckia sp. 28-YEA-48]